MIQASHNILILFLEEVEKIIFITAEYILKKYE